MRSIYTKIFLWFWLVALGATAAVTVITVASGSQPIGRRLMSTTVQLAAHSAVDLYEQGGRAALVRYIEEIEASGPIEAALLDSNGNDLAGRGIPEGTAEVLRRVRSGDKMQTTLALRWAAACVVTTSRGSYILVVRVYPLRGAELWPNLAAMALKTMIALLATGILCLLLARHLARPIRALQGAARKIADGDLSVRTAPAIGQRQDELADLAHDFDRMAARIEALVEKQRELLGDISHELRSPLTRINVSLELVRRGDPTALERVQKDLDKLEELIEQILTLTRLQSLEAQRTVTSVRLDGVLRSVAEDARFEGSEHGKEVEVGVCEDCILAGDPGLVRSAIENIVRNAVRHTRTQTAVELSLVFKDGWARILVADRGDGVAPDALTRLFEPFYRTSEARDSASGGFGLGLSISQRVALLYGGKIVARNRDGGGLEVEIAFPATRLP